MNGCKLPETKLDINSFAVEVHATATEHGWWQTERSFGEQIALMHSELSEALEEARNGHAISETYYEQTPQGPKPDGVPSELADVIIRVLDTCAHYGIDIESILKEKARFNKARPYKHGGKQF